MPDPIPKDVKDMLRIVVASAALLTDCGVLRFEDDQHVIDPVYPFRSFSIVGKLAFHRIRLVETQD